MKTRILAPALAGLLFTAGVPALEFSQTWFFGDSLTDSGAFTGNADAGEGGKFTTNPGPVWAEDLAGRVGGSARPVNPANPNLPAGGTNYAQGGAQVTNPQGIGQTPSPQNALPIHDQVSLYLDAHGHADGDALYSLWGGANDLFFGLGMVAAGQPPEAAFGYAAGSAQALAGEAQRLTSAGARYLVVPLLPDFARLPAWVLETVSRAGEGNPNADQALYAAARVLALGGADPATVYAQALAAAEAELGLPGGALTGAYQNLAGLASGLSLSYNQALLGAMGQVKGNLILLDTRALFDEMAANPAAFGLLNVTGTACTTPSSLYCTAATLVDPRAPGVFLFADAVHPTTAGHRIFADYAYSVLAAPALVASLPEVALGNLRGHQAQLLGQIDSGFGDGWSLFLGGGLGSQTTDAGQSSGTDSDERRLLAGLARRLGQGLTLGGAIDLARSEADFAHGQGGFDLDTFTFSLFADYRQGALFATLLGSWALQADFDRVERVVRLGGGVRSERGDTQGDLWGLEARVGYALWQQDGLSLAPYAALDYLSAQVDGYREAGTRSTAMHFGSQDRDSLLLEGGLQADYRWGANHARLGAGYQKELKDDSRSLRAGLNGLEGGRDFRLHDITPSDHAWRLDLAVDRQVAPGVNLGLGWQYRRGEGDDRWQQFELRGSVIF